MAKKTEKEERFHKAVFKQMLALATSGLGLVAALAWNELIKEIMAEYIKPLVGIGSGILSLLLYALIVTVLAVTVTYNLAKIVDRG